MNKKNTLIIGVFLISFVVIGCVPQWQLAGPNTEFVDSNGHYSLNIPNGWMYLKTTPGGDVVLSTDGPMLQSITTSSKTFDKAFTESKADVKPGLLAFELMEYYIAEYKAKYSTVPVEVETREAIQISGRDGFRVTMSFKNMDGLRYKVVTVGCSDEEGVYLLTYGAPMIYYYEKNLADFEKLVTSFKIL